MTLDDLIMYGWITLGAVIVWKLFRFLWRTRPASSSSYLACGKGEDGTLVSVWAYNPMQLIMNATQDDEIFVECVFEDHTSILFSIIDEYGKPVIRLSPELEMAEE